MVLINIVNKIENYFLEIRNCFVIWILDNQNIERIQMQNGHQMLRAYLIQIVIYRKCKPKQSCILRQWADTVKVSGLHWNHVAKGGKCVLLSNHNSGREKCESYVCVCLLFCYSDFLRGKLYIIVMKNTKLRYFYLLNHFSFLNIYFCCCFWFIHDQMTNFLTTRRTGT